MDNLLENFREYRLRFESIKLATNNFAKGNYIAEGGFGKVYRGELVDSNGPTVVAVKRVYNFNDQTDVSFWNEIKLLSSYRHRNMVSFVGFCYESKERIIVYEYAPNGSLDRYLHDPNLTWIQRLNICLGAARGLEYLHDPRGTHKRVLHRDIKSANILLDEKWNAKVADFGLFKYCPASEEHSIHFSNAKGTLGYCAPEYAETMILTKESDVYSFGVVLFEVLCSRSCYDNRYRNEKQTFPHLVKKYYQEKTLDKIIDGKLKQQMEQNSFDTFVKLACQCLEEDRTLRPPMALVVKMLAKALKHQEDFEANSQEAKRRNIVLHNIILKDMDNPLLDFDQICPPGGNNSLVLYTTGVNTNQQAFKDCLRIQLLLKSLNVLYQERNVSIHWDYKEELWRMLGRRVALPRLFIKGRYIGGADEVLQLHEQGKFQPLLTGIPQNILK